VITVNELRRILDGVSDNGNGDHLIMVVEYDDDHHQGMPGQATPALSVIIGDGYVAIDTDEPFMGRKEEAK